MCDFKQESVGICSEVFINIFKWGAMEFLMVSLKYEMVPISFYR